MIASANLIPLVIDRERWARGGKPGTLLLNDKDGSMCCLGFACLAAGVPSSKLIDMGSPEDLAITPALAAFVTQEEDPDSYDDEEISYRSGNNSSTEAAIDVNDDKELTDPEREDRLKPILAKLGFDVTFVDHPLAQPTEGG